jgi:sulfide:quinone oxidoreductase
MNISQVAEKYSVTPQVLPEDVASLAAEGYVAIICNRPDGEEPGQPTAAEIADECAKVGLGFHHLPVAGMPISTEVIQQQRRLIDDSDGPVLGYCRTGQRSLIIWQASA